MALSTVLSLSMTAAEPVAPYQRLSFPKLRAVELPKVETATLPNGMRLYMLENHELPLISGFALVRTGNLFDSKYKVGLASMTGTVMRTGGTTSKTSEQLDVALENVAASVESGIGESSGSVSFSAVKGSEADVLQIFHDVLTQPAFRQEKIDLAKTQAKGSIARRDDDPSSIAGRELDALVYGRQTPYGWRTEAETIDRIQRNDLIAFHKRYFFPANIMLAVEGDFNAAEMKARLTTLFADWTVQQEAVPPFPQVSPQNNAGLYFVPRSDVNQTFFALGHLGGTIREKDYPALQVMADILGGSFSSRLFKRVRTQLGYAYDISAGWSANFNHPGVFIVSGSTKSASTVDSLKAIREEIDRIRTSPVTDAELESSKQTTLNSFVFNFDTPSKTLNRLITYQYFGYPEDLLTRYQESIRGVTKADVLRVAKERLTPDKLAIVAVGNPAELGKPLTELGVTVKPLGDKPAAAPAGADTRPAAVSLLQKMQQAIGGATELRAVKDATYQAEAELKSPMGNMKASQTVRWLAPATLRQDQSLPFGKVAVFDDGKSGWVSSPQGTMQLPPPVARQMNYERFRFLLALLQSDSDTSRQLSLIAPDTVEIRNAAGTIVRVKIDPQTGLPAGQNYPSAALGGGEGTVEETYSDWKAVGKLQLPHKITIVQNGKPVGDTVIRSWSLNTGLTPEELSKKP